MVFEFKFPDVGEGIKEGEIVKWKIKKGDTVKENEVIGQIETDKAVVDMPSPVSGKIIKINFKEGEKIQVGETMVTIDEGKNKKKVKSDKTSTSVVGEIDSNSQEIKYEHEKIEKSNKENRSPVKVLASPVVRKKASEMRINLIKIKGSGENGRVLMNDLKTKEKTISVKKRIIKKKYDDYGYIERIPLKGVRKIIAEHMIESSRKAPQVTSMEEINVLKLWRRREKEKKRLIKKNIKLTFLPFIIKAVISALKKHPILNSTINGEEIIIKKYYNIGVATETEAGLMVPVIKIADSKTIVQLAKEISSLIKKARERKIDLMDLKGGTFTITNYGSVGGTYGTPLINYPEASILGVGRIYEKLVMDKNKKLNNIKILPVSLTFDHRILDGAQAARFLESLKNSLENPDHLLVEMK